VLESVQEEMAHCLKALAEGNAEAFDRFYARYAPFVLAIAVRKLGDRMEAEDLCHDIFLEVLRRGGAYDPSRGTVEAWLAVLTRSRCVDRLRRKSRTAAERLDGAADPGGAAVPAEIWPEQLVVAKLERESLRAALERLPEVQRQAVAGAYLENRTHRELSDGWRVPLGTVKSWIRYGIGNLRKQLEKNGWTEAKGGNDRG